MRRIIKTINIGIWIFYLISVIPMLYMGKFIHPLWDDFSSSYQKVIWFEQKHFVLYFIYPLLNAIVTYFHWQGTYSAEMLFALQPGAWIIPSYWITPFIIIGSITLAYRLFWRTMSQYVFHSDAVYGSIIAGLLLCVQFQYTPFLHEGFYWFNGAIYYGFFYALMIIELSLVLRVVFGGKCNKIALIALAVFVSGGNYSTALINILALIILCFTVFVQKKEKNTTLLHVTIAALIGFIISIIAPGNAVRAAQCTPMPAMKAIYTSVIDALRNGRDCLATLQIGLIILMIPVIHVMVAKRKLSLFNMSAAVVILFGLFAAQSTPAYYAMSYSGGLRQLDMYYYSFYMLVALCVTCFITWLSSISSFEKMFSRSMIRVSAVIALIGMVITVNGVLQKGVSNTNFYIVASEIYSGRAAAYDSEYNDRIDQIVSSGEICYIEDIEATRVLDSLRISEDPDYWINDAMALYYGKERIYCTSESDRITENQ